MLDYHTQLVSTLKTILPTYHELKLTSKTPIPCISYLEITNVNETEITPSTTLGYNRIVYQVKVSGTDVAKIQEAWKKIDKALRAIGWRRSGSGGEQLDKQSSKMQKTFDYERLALENFD